MKKIIIYIFCFYSFLLAELPPYIYEEMKENSPEVLKLIVDDVQLKASNTSKSKVEIKATVVNVIKTKTGLQQNSQILIVYELQKFIERGYVGPAPLKALKKEKQYTAYLKYSIEDKAYFPSAKGLSFEILDNEK